MIKIPFDKARLFIQRHGYTLLWKVRVTLGNGEPSNLRFTPTEMLSVLRAAEENNEDLKVVIEVDEGSSTAYLDFAN